MFEANNYRLVRKFMNLIGREYYVYDTNENLVAYIYQKGFKLKENIICYSDASKSKIIFEIQARNMIDFSGSYDVLDENKTKLGMVQRQGLKSMLQDEWKMFDKDDKEIGVTKEDSMGLALLRRFLTNLVPQNYDMFLGQQKVVDLKQNFNPFMYKLNIEFLVNELGGVDRRMVMAQALMLASIEGKQG